MIQICPAILVSNEADFKHQISLYAPIFDTIDIDINIDNDAFYGEVTIDPFIAVSLIAQYTNSFNIHLMVQNPAEVITQLKDKDLISPNLTFFIHQESKFQAVLEEYPDLPTSIVVKAESYMRSIAFYNQFQEVQLMTIITGKQGNDFIPEVLERVEWLRENGYSGKISLDGSVNLQSASLIREFAVDRVSVGSFFSKAEDLQVNISKLQLALNM